MYFFKGYVNVLWYCHLIPSLYHCYTEAAYKVSYNAYRNYIEIMCSEMYEICEYKYSPINIYSTKVKSHCISLS